MNSKKRLKDTISVLCIWFVPIETTDRKENMVGGTGVTKNSPRTYLFQLFDFLLYSPKITS